jgi:hypothetical protein
METPPPSAPPGRRLPPRDFVLIPLLCLLTVLVMLGGSEIGARVAMLERPDDPCLVPDPILGHRPRALCVSHTKAAEGEWTENRYNDCGYRSDTSCRPLPPGALRVAVVGTSMSWGWHIPTEQTWYSRMGRTLSSLCGRPVDVQNLAGGFNLAQAAYRTPEAVALKPTVAVMITNPFDIENVPAGPFAPGAPGLEAKPKEGLKKIQEAIVGSRAVLAAQHFIFRQPNVYIPLYLRYGDKADFLRPPFKPAWTQRLAYVDAALGYMADRFHAAGIPLVLLFIPQEAQADIVATGQTYPGVDPFAFSRAVGVIARKHGIIYEDMVPYFSDIRDARDYYLNVDQHLSGKGNGLEADIFDRVLTRGAVPQFDACVRTGGA